MRHSHRKRGETDRPRLRSIAPALDPTGRRHFRRSWYDGSTSAMGAVWKMSQMEKTWASGALELLRHAYSHIEGDSAFDKRMAFISIDNCVEVSLRTFFALPKSKSGIKVSRPDFDAAIESFPKLVALLKAHAPTRLSGLDDIADIEHYHRIRNILYHNGTGLSVDEEYLLAYRGIAEVLVQNLFGITPTKRESSPSLETLIHSWNRIDKLIRTALEHAGFTSTYKWEEAVAAGVLKSADVNTLTELRMARNRMVHSDTIDAEEIAFWARRSSKVLKDLEQRLSSDRPSLTAQRRAWMEMNDGDDVRGSRPDDDHARAVVERYGGIRKSGNYRFPDGSVLQVRRGRIVASPDPVRSKYSCGFPMVET